MNQDMMDNRTYSANHNTNALHNPQGSMQKGLLPNPAFDNMVGIGINNNIGH